MLCFVFVALAFFGCCAGYSLGPPLEVCANMTPGHPYQPQTIGSPFTFTLNATEYRPGDVIEVFLNSSGDWFLEGTLIQMRKVDCGNDLSDKDQAVGTFMTEENDVFLEPFNCFERSASAIRHYSHMHIYNRTFYWKAPAEAAGHVRIRATIARNEETFWMNVMSDYLWDASDDDRQTCGAVGNSITVTVLALLLTLQMVFFIIA